MNCYFKAYQGSEPYIFVSYCHKDKEQVYPLIDRLNIEGYRVWFDEGIQAGDKWLEVVAQNLAGAAVCVSAVSVGASESHNCINELNFAVSKKKPLVPVVLEDFQMTIALQLLLASTNYIKKPDFPNEDAFYTAFLASPTLQSCRAANAVPPSAAQLGEWRRRCREYGRKESTDDLTTNTLPTDPMSEERDRLHRIDLKLTECEHLIAAVRSSVERMQTETVTGDRKKYNDTLIRKATDASDKAKSVSFEGKWVYFLDETQEARKRADDILSEAKALIDRIHSYDVSLSLFAVEREEIDGLTKQFAALRAEYKALSSRPEVTKAEEEAFSAKLAAFPRNDRTWKYFDYDAEKLYADLAELRERAGKLPVNAAPMLLPDRNAEKQDFRRREDEYDVIEAEVAAFRERLDGISVASASDISALAALRKKTADAQSELNTVGEKLRMLSRPVAYRYYSDENDALMKKCGGLEERVAQYEQRLRELNAEAESAAKEIERRLLEEEKLKNEQARIEKTISELEALDVSVAEAVSAASGRPCGVSEAERLRERARSGRDELNRLLSEAAGLRVTHQQAVKFRECRDRLIRNLEKLEKIKAETSVRRTDADATLILPPAVVIDMETAELFYIRDARTALGRQSQQCDIAITENSSISRVHAHIIFSHGRFYLTDNSSTWGSSVNGKRLGQGEKAALGEATPFELSDERMMFISGDGARTVQKLMRLRTLRSVESGETKPLLDAELPLDRRHAWSENVLSDKYVSHFRHAVIIPDADGCCIQDLGSTNGTRLNEKKLMEGEKYPLRSGDMIRIARNEFEYKELRLHLGGRGK